MKKIINLFNKHNSLICTLFFSIIAIIIFGNLSNHSNAWYDEVYQLILNENNLKDIINYVANDFHVPFYAVGLKLITSIFGSSLFVARMFSLSAIICCFILAFYKIKSLFSMKTALIFSCFLLSLSCIYFCAIEIRPYSWPMFLTLASSVYMISIMKNKDVKSWISYVLFSVLAMYSHNFGLIYVFISNVILGIYLVITNRKMLKPYGIAYLIKLILYLPWLSVLVTQYKGLKNKFWIEKPILLKFIDGLNKLFSINTYIVYLLTMIVLLSILYTVIKRINKKNSYILFLNFFITLIFCYLISLYATPLLIPKYVVTFIGVFILAISDFIASVKSKVWICLLLIILFVSAVINYKYEIKLKDESNVRNLKQTIKNDSNISFLHYSEFSLGMFRYFFPNAKHYYTDEIDSNLRSYDLFGKNVIKLNDINELDNIDEIWTINLKNHYEDQKYFKNWKTEKKHTYINTYHYENYFLEQKIKP